MSKPLEMTMESFGVSPWELEVAYGYFNSRFVIRQELIEEEDPDFFSTVSMYSNIWTIQYSDINE